MKSNMAAFAFGWFLGICTGIWLVAADWLLP